MCWLSGHLKSCPAWLSLPTCDGGTDLLRATLDVGYTMLRVIHRRRKAQVRMNGGLDGGVKGEEATKV